jgi:hypothetical protein
VATLNRHLAALAALLSASGCASFARFDSPRTAPPGTREVLFTPSVYLGRSDGTAFNTDLIIRMGLGERSDVGVRFDLLGVAADLKLQLARASDPTSGVDLAVAPLVGYGSDTAWQGSSGSSSQNSWNWQVGLPVLVGINLGSYQVVVSPELLYQRVAALPEGILDAGGTLAVGKVGGTGFSIYPVVAVWKALDARHPATSLSGPGALVVQPALVLRWGP